MRKILLAMALSFFGALALSDPADAPCKEDSARLCPGKTWGKGLGLCLKANKDKLSEGCRKKIDEGMDKLKQAKDACEDDVAKFCSQVKPGRGRIIRCLKDHESELSEKCKDLRKQRMGKSGM